MESGDRGEGGGRVGTGSGRGEQKHLGLLLSGAQNPLEEDPSSFSSV